jgi:hypothetical protein
MADLRLHPSAAENFNRKAEELLTKVQPVGGEQSSSVTSFEPNIIPDVIITGADISGGATRQSFDIMSGELLDLTFDTTNGVFKIPKDQYKGFVDLVESIQKTVVFRSVISIEFIEKNIKNWLQKRIQHEAVDDLSSFLQEKAEEAVQTYEIWIPIAYLYLEEELSLGAVRFRTLSSQVFNNWFGNDPHLQKERQRLQALAAATTTIYAEQAYAVSESLKLTEHSLALLRILHPSNCSPHTVFSCFPLGSEKTIARFSAYIANDTHFMGKKEEFLPPFPDRWVISSPWLSACRGILEKINKILSIPERDRSEFQGKLLEALLIYSKNNITKDYGEKLIFILTALESMLNSNKSDPIQVSVADRMAFFLGKPGEERRSIVKLFRKCYDLRSNFVHHGETISDLYSLREFMALSHKFFLILIDNHGNYASKAEFLEKIDEIKYG